jgi:hypothetical protein
MPWLNVPKGKRGPATLEDWMAETRTTRATCGALASSVATLTLEIGRLEARLEAVMVNGLPAHACEPCPNCSEVTRDE